MVNETIERLRAALQQPGITKRKLAADAGIHRNTLLGCEDDDWNPSAKTLRAIEPYLPELQPNNGSAKRIKAAA